MADRIEPNISEGNETTPTYPGRGGAWVIFCLCIILLMGTGCYFDEMEDPLPPQGVISYALDIQPIFSNNCTVCHPGQVMDLYLTAANSYSSITNGVYIIPNDPDGSLLFQRLLGNPTPMPPGGSLQSAEIELIRTWIEQGALNN